LGILLLGWLRELLPVAFSDAAPGLKHLRQHVFCFALERSPRFVISTDDEGAVATEAEWRDPETFSSAMLMQGVLFKLTGCFPLGSMRDGSSTNSGFTSFPAGSGSLGQSLERMP